MQGVFRNPLVGPEIAGVSSGNGAIDIAVHQTLAPSHPQLLPSGYFHGSLTISFDLSR